MSIDHKEVKRGIKQLELDKYRYYGNLFLSIIFGVLIGTITQNAFVGIVALIISAIIAGKKYYEV